MYVAMTSYFTWVLMLTQQVLFPTEPSLQSLLLFSGGFEQLSSRGMTSRGEGQLWKEDILVCTCG